MSDQAPVEETPETVDETVAVDEQPGVNWEKRYNDLRPEFDRTSQEAAQYRQLVEGLSDDDFDTRQRAAEALGIEFVDTEDDDDEDPYEDPRDQRLSAAEQWIANREAQESAQAQAAQEQAIVDQAAEIVGQQLADLNLDDETEEWIFARSLAMPKTPEGLPDIEAAHAHFVAFENGRKAAWASTKKGVHVSPVGMSGTQAPDLDDPAQRQAWMAQRLADMDT